VVSISKLVSTTFAYNNPPLRYIIANIYHLPAVCYIILRISPKNHQEAHHRVKSGLYVTRSEFLGLRPGPTILLGSTSNLGQVIYSHCLPTAVFSASRKWGKKGVLGLDRFNGL